MKRSFWRQESVFDQKKSRKENIKYKVEGTLIIVLLSAFFYRSLWAIPCLLPILFLYVKEKKKIHVLKQKRQMQVQFKDAILSISGNQKVGYSIENSFRRAYDDVKVLYGKDSIICKELYIINIGLGNNVILEKLLHDFGRKSQVEDIVEFAEVFAVAKRSGGNMTEIIERSAAVIEEKVETEKEIQILLASKQMEQKVMNVVPFGIIMYISVTSRGFFDVLYHNLPGVIIMTVCLLAYMTAVLISRKMVRIEV